MVIPVSDYAIADLQAAAEAYGVNYDELSQQYEAFKAHVLTNMDSVFNMSAAAFDKLKQDTAREMHLEYLQAAIEFTVDQDNIRLSEEASLSFLFGDEERMTAIQTRLHELPEQRKEAFQESFNNERIRGYCGITCLPRVAVALDEHWNYRHDLSSEDLSTLRTLFTERWPQRQDALKERDEAVAKVEENPVEEPAWALEYKMLHITGAAPHLTEGQKAEYEAWTNYEKAHIKASVNTPRLVMLQRHWQEENRQHNFQSIPDSDTEARYCYDSSRKNPLTARTGTTANLAPEVS